MAGWRTAKCLDVLLHQVDAAYPGRDKQNDGTIGDERHQATKSEHNPDSNGIVRARDITHDPAHGLDARKLAEALVASRDNRILYVISNQEICSSVVSPWVWRPYDGENPHREHMHLSVVETPALYDDERLWNLDGKSESLKTIVLDAATIDKIAALAASSDLARWEWQGRGRAPTGFPQGMAVSYAQALGRLAVPDSVARAMVRVVNGPNEHDVFDHLAAEIIAAGWKIDAPDVDRLRLLWIILTGLAMRESSGGEDIGQDSSAPENRTSDQAEAGTWQQSWDSRGASPELPKLLTLYCLTDPDQVDRIFGRGVNVRPGSLQNYGDGDGLAFQKLAKTRPSIAILFAAIGLRTLRTHWGPINGRAIELVPAADALFRQVEAIMTTPATAPVPFGYDTMPVIMIGANGPVVTRLQGLLGIPQNGQFGMDTDAAVRAFQAAEGLDVDGEVGPLTWAALMDVAPPKPKEPTVAEQKPIPDVPITPITPRPPQTLPALPVKMIDIGAAVDFVLKHEQESFDFLSLLNTIHNSRYPNKQVGIMPTPVVPIVQPPPTPAAVPMSQRPSVQIGATALAGTALAQILGYIGPPVNIGDLQATLPGVLSTALPIAVTALGGLGVWGRLASGVLSIFGPMVTAAVAKKIADDKAKQESGK